VVAAWRAGERQANELERRAREVLGTDAGLVTDYIAIAHPERLAPVELAEPGTVIALAVRVGGTRLIDNTILEENDL
jgi:pantothenate synthetase